VCIAERHVGMECVVEVTGHFCCACRELWQDRDALSTHCASEKHRQNYEVRHNLNIVLYYLI